MQQREIAKADLELSKNAQLARNNPTASWKESSQTSKYDNRGARQPGNATSSLNSMSMSENYFNATKPAKPAERSKTFYDSAKRLNQLAGKVKKQADKSITAANNVARQTLNKHADYQNLERQQPEMQLIDHFRHVNQRVLSAEEQDVMLQCTPLYCENAEYRRYLPDTIGRRSGLCKEDMRQTYLKMESEHCIKQAYDVLENRRYEQDSQFKALQLNEE